MIASLDLVKGVKECDLIIVCDKMKVIEPDKKTNWKSGKVNSDSQLKYELYIETLRKKYLQSDDMENTTTSEHIGNGYRIAGELNDTLCSKEMSAVDDKNKGNITNYSLKNFVFFTPLDWAQHFFSIVIMMNIFLF